MALTFTSWSEYTLDGVAGTLDWPPTRYSLSWMHCEAIRQAVVERYKARGYDINQDPVIEWVDGEPTEWDPETGEPIAWAPGSYQMTKRGFHFLLRDPITRYSKLDYRFFAVVVPSLLGTWDFGFGNWMDEATFVDGGSSFAAPAPYTTGELKIAYDIYGEADCIVLGSGLGWPKMYGAQWDVTIDQSTGELTGYTYNSLFGTRPAIYTKIDYRAAVLCYELLRRCLSLKLTEDVSDEKPYSTYAEDEDTVRTASTAGSTAWADVRAAIASGTPSGGPYERGNGLVLLAYNSGQRDGQLWTEIPGDFDVVRNGEKVVATFERWVKPIAGNPSTFPDGFNAMTGKYEDTADFAADICKIGVSAAVDDSTTTTTVTWSAYGTPTEMIAAQPNNPADPPTPPPYLTNVMGYGHRLDRADYLRFADSFVFGSE